jgi:hypothetical protein
MAEERQLGVARGEEDLAEVARAALALLGRLVDEDVRALEDRVEEREVALGGLDRLRGRGGVVGGLGGLGGG